MTNVIFIFFIEFVICNVTKGLAPEDDSFFD